MTFSQEHLHMTASHFQSLTLNALFGCLIAGPALALGLADLSNQDAARGIKGALNQGAASAVAKLGIPGGFLNNPKVKIPLPHRELAAGPIFPDDSHRVTGSRTHG